MSEQSKSANPLEIEKAPNTLFGIWLAVWLTVTVAVDSWAWGIMAACLFTLLILSVWQGWLQVGLRWLWLGIKYVALAALPDRSMASADATISTAYDLVLGIAPETGETITVNLLKTGHWVIVGTTGSGKTRFTQNLIYQMAKNQSPEQLNLLIMDGKGLSFLIWDQLPHAVRPVSRTHKAIEASLRFVVEEMERRNQLMSALGHSGRVCENIADYAEITGEKLPIIIVYIDEKAEGIAPKSDADGMVTTLARLGRSAGIVLMCATQTPYVENINGELSSNSATKVAFHIADKRVKGVVAQIPAEFHPRMLPKPGLAYIYSPQIGHTMFQAPYIKNCELERLAKQLGEETAPDRWQAIKDEQAQAERVEQLKMSNSAMKAWSNYDKATKMLRLQAFVTRIGRMPRNQELVKQFGMTRQTATKWLKKIPSEWLE